MVLNCPFYHGYTWCNIGEKAKLGNKLLCFDFADDFLKISEDKSLVDMALEPLIYMAVGAFKY